MSGEWAPEMKALTQKMDSLNLMNLYGTTEVVINFL